jgi:hypothetical protein
MRNIQTRNSPYYHFLKYLLFLLKHPVYIVQWSANVGQYTDLNVRFIFPYKYEITRVGSSRNFHYYCQWKFNYELISQLTDTQWATGQNSFLGNLDVAVSEVDCGLSRRQIANATRRHRLSNSDWSPFMTVSHQRSIKHTPLKRHR